MKRTAGLTVACLVGAESNAWAASFLGAPKISEQQNGWYKRPMRWAQIGFTEDDPGNYDPQFWLDYFQRLHVDAVCLNGGGAVAFYPTEIPLHYRSRWLGNMDTFGDLMKSCRALGMNVVARTDAHACHQDVYDVHPDWIAVDEHGNKRKHPSDPDYWITCALGPYNFVFMTRVHEEIMTKYMPDGIFTNRWAGSGMCYCEHCEINFSNFSGMALPRTHDPLDPARRQYLVWHQQRLFELWRLWKGRIGRINPHAGYIANAGGGALSELDMKTVGELAPTLFADRQGRAGLMPPWENGKFGKEYRATMGHKAIVNIFSMGLEDKYRWKDSVQTADEIRLWVMDGVAHGLRPWFTKFDAKVIDARWMPVVEEIYKWHAANEQYLRNVCPLARAGLVYSQQTAAYYGGENAQAKVEDPSLGFYQAMVEARIPFEMVHDHLLDSEHISQFRTLVLPNIAALSTQQCRQIEEFVKDGGSIVATFETSLYDEWGVRRENFGLSSLLGVSYGGKVEGPMLNSYLSLEKDPATGEFPALLNGFEDAVRIINGTNQVLVNPVGKSVHPLQVVPTYPDLPMEEVFPRKGVKGQLGAVMREYGQGRVVYLPGDIDRTFWETLDFDQAKLLRNAVLWATNEPAPLTVEGKGVLDISIWSQKNSVTAHLVNLTNPMMMKGPIREIIPITSQEVCVLVPQGRKVKRVHLLVTGTDVQYTNKAGVIRLLVSSIGLHEVVAIDLA
jgi:Hypothetical glycosyl hydrolase 6/Beta-galactosidase trimerisation domain